MVISECFSLWSIKIWEVLLQQKAYSQQNAFASYCGPTFNTTYSHVTRWGVYLGHVKIAFSTACVHRQSRDCVLTPRQTASRNFQRWARVKGMYVNVEPLSSEFLGRRRRWEEAEVARLKNSQSLGSHRQLLVWHLVGALTASCLSSARDGVKKKIR